MRRVPAQLGDRRRGLVGAEGLAVPSLLVRHERNARALHGLRDDARGLLVLGQRFPVRRIDGGDVVPVDLDGVPPEGAGAGGVDRPVPAEVRRSALAKPVHVQDGDHVVQLVVARLVERFPDRALGHLAVTQQHPDVERQLVDVLGAQGHADADGQALPEGAGRHIHPGQAARRAVGPGKLQRLRVSLEPAAERAQRNQLLVGDGARRLVHRVEQGASMPLGEDQAVVVGRSRILPVVLEVIDQEHRHQVGGRHRGRRMAGSGRRGAPDAVHPELLPQLRDALQFTGHEDGSSGGLAAMLTSVHA